MYLIFQMHYGVLLQKNLCHFCLWAFEKVRVPTRTGKPGKMGRHFPVREKLGNFEQTGKFRENHTKYWKIQGILDRYIICYFLVIFKCTMYHLLKWIKFSVKNRTLKNILAKWKKTLEKSGNFVSPEKWEPWRYRKSIFRWYNMEHKEVFQ